MIYCVEDDQGIRELMIYTLKASGFEARGFVTGEELMEGLAAERPQLILLDIMLPGEDGVSILQRLKTSQDTKDIPVIMASAKGTEYDKVMGLDLGADDYLVKPFGMMEMISRIRAVLRRSGTTISAGSLKAEEDLTNGAIRMCDADHTVWIDKTQIELTLKEYELLRLFLKETGRVFTRDQLLNQVWGIEFAGESRTVDVHIGTLRHINRMKKGLCSIDAGFVLSDLLTNLERCSDHCSNIAGSMIDAEAHTRTIHETLRFEREQSAFFGTKYLEFQKKYHIA